MNNEKEKNKTEDNLKEIITNTTGLLKEFSSFFSVIFKPWVIASIAGTIALIYFTRDLSGKTKIIFDILTALSAGIAGNFISAYFIEQSGNTFLIKKGISAIRNLQLIKYKVTNINSRCKKLRRPETDRDYDEIENLVENVNKDIINSIGDWRDVNPKLEEVVDFYELVSNAENQFKEMLKEKKSLEKELNGIEETNTAAIQKLKDDIEKKDEQITKLQSKLTPDYSSLGEHKWFLPSSLGLDTATGVYFDETGKLYETLTGKNKSQLK